MGSIITDSWVSMVMRGLCRSDLSFLGVSGCNLAPGGLSFDGLTSVAAASSSPCYCITYIPSWTGDAAALVSAPFTTMNKSLTGCGFFVLGGGCRPLIVDYPLIVRTSSTGDRSPPRSPRHPDPLHPPPSLLLLRDPSDESWLPSPYPRDPHPISTCHFFLLTSGCEDQ